MGDPHVVTGADDRDAGVGRDLWSTALSAFASRLEVLCVDDQLTRLDVNDAIVDTTGVQLDGDSDGVPGGVFNYWMRVEDASKTIFVDKVADSVATQVDGSGTLADPYDTISNPTNLDKAAFERAANRILVPVDGAAAFQDGDTFTIDDTTNQPVTFTFRPAYSPRL